MNNEQKRELRVRANALGLYANLRADAGVAALLALLGESDPVRQAAHFAAYYAALAERGCQSNAAAYFERLVRRDENVFSRAAARGDDIAPFLATAERELQTLGALASLTPDSLWQAFTAAEQTYLPVWQCGAFRLTAQTAADSYRTNGYGVFADSIAYTYNPRDKRFSAVANVNPIRLSDLKNYEEEKRAVVDNTLSFIERLPAANVLLYGDRGTGKSSTVHAVLNEFAPRGLRLLELSKAAIPDFPQIIARLHDFSFRFIVFLDDLTFIEGADDYAELKAALEGSVAKADNVVIYATTNRRHLLKESYADRQGDDMHAADTVEEQMSLSDRFGLVITFMGPDKREFLSILGQILRDRGIRLDETALGLMAERYALRKGGRSPRAARQLADRIESRLKRNLPPDGDW